MEVTLSDLIDQVREELLTPRHQEGATPFLFVDEVELELNVSVSKKVEGSGKVSIKVIEVGGGGGKTDQQTHRITVKMTPLLTKSEVRNKLQQDGKLWAAVESFTTQATTKESGMVGEE